MKLLKRVSGFAFLLLSLGTLLAFVPRAWPLDLGLEQIIAKFQRINKEYPQEKVYLHLDKPYYAAGEDVWFKAYLADASVHTPSQLSKVLYVELISPEDSVYKRVVVKMQDGMGHGDFALSDTISEGLYRVRAYTNWMQNFPEDYFFHQNLNIYNPRVQDVVPAVHFQVKPQAKGDSVAVSVALKNQQGEALPNTAFTFVTRSGRGASSKRQGVTNAQGNASLSFYVPDNQNRDKAQLQLMVQQGKTQFRKSFLVPTASQKKEVQFFPEGGTLVNGVPNVVGIKAVNEIGLGREVQGGIYDQEGSKIQDIRTQALGMGRFYHLPVKGKKYEARITHADGSKEIYPLPVAQDQGVVMAVDNTKPDNIKIRIFLPGFVNGVGRPKTIHIIGQSRGVLYFSGSGDAAKDLLLVDMPRKNFPDGVAQITIFSDTGTPLAERLVFINQSKPLQLTLSPDKAVYKAREKVTMRLQAKDGAGNPVAGQFSVSVTDQARVAPQVNGGNILTNLLLTSDLRGHIEQPGYYFSNQNPETVLALDNLMLTQGWRRFVWQDVLQDKLPVITHPLEQAITISGTVLKPSGKPEANATMLLYDLKNGGMLQDVAEPTGKFIFNVTDMNDSSRIVLQARSAKGGKSNMKVELEKELPFAPVRPQVPYALPAGPFSEEVNRYLQGNREQLRLDQLAGKSILLNSVEIRGRKDKEEDQFSRPIYGTPDKSLKAADLPMAGDLISNLAGRVAGVQVSGGSISMRGGGTPLFLLDGMPVEIDYIRSVSMNDVEKIDILMPGASSAIYGSQGGNGVVAVILKRGEARTPVVNPWSGIAAYNGKRFQIAREFYMPPHDQPTQTEMPDLRTTIAWVPTLTTDAAGTATFSFFCADASTTYRAAVEGLSFNGQPGYGLVTLEVR